MALSSNVIITQAGTPYIKRAGTFERFVWAGRQAKRGEADEDLGGLEVTTRQNPRGGIERDSILQDVPGTVDFDIVLKHVQANRLKTELKQGFFFHVDKRVMRENGRDRDAPDKWIEIDRVVWSKAASRTSPESSWEGEEEGMVTIPMQGLSQYDIYPVNLATFANATAVSLTDVSVAQGETQTELPLVYAVSTLLAAGSPILYVNEYGGDLDQWTATSLTEWTTGGAVAVLGLGDFLIIVSTAEDAILRSDDRGVTRVEVTHADWATNAPTHIDGVDQTKIFICGQAGNVWLTDDSGRTIQQSNVGSAETTTQNLNKIHIDRTNHLNIWACGASNALIKSENGGLSWFPITGPSAADGLLDIWADSLGGGERVLIINDDGELWESKNGGTTWTQQTALPSMPATLTSASIAYHDGGVFYIVCTNGTTHNVYRNVEDGAAGYWQKVNTSNPSQGLVSVAIVDQNVAVAVGGSGTTANLFALIS